MAINPNTQYPGKIAAPDANYPYGGAQNITVPGDGTGTPWEKALVNDIFGMQQALLKSAGIVPSGSADKVGASQYLQSIVELVSGRAYNYDDSGIANAYVLDLRTDQQFASSLFIGLLVKFTPITDNSGPSTLDYNTTIDAIVDRTGNALIGGELIAGIENIAIFDGVNWRLTTGVEIDLLIETFTHEMTADADYTLTANNNRSGRIIITDAPVTLTGTVNIIVADIKRTFYVQNDTAQALVFKTSAGTGITIYPNNTSQLLCDGTNIIRLGSVLNTKVIDIGDWDMDATAAISIPTASLGFTAGKIRSISALIRNDADNATSSIESKAGVNEGFVDVSVFFGNEQINIGRLAAGFYDSVDYNATSYNRGWIVIQYVD